MEEENYLSVYNETIHELKRLFHLKVKRNNEEAMETVRKRTIELWKKLAVKHNELPKRGDKPMVHFGGVKNGEPIKHI